MKWSKKRKDYELRKRSEMDKSKVEINDPKMNVQANCRGEQNMCTLKAN